MARVAVGVAVPHLRSELPRHRRRRAAEPGESAGTLGRGVLPRRPAALAVGGCADARPLGLCEPGGGGGAVKKLETKSAVLLTHHLKALKLPTMTAECEKVAAHVPRENVDHLGFLLQLSELELLDRERRSAERRLKAAKFPTPKGLDGFDFASAPSVNKPMILELMRCEYVERRENVLLIGGSGTGKTHLVMVLDPDGPAELPAERRSTPSAGRQPGGADYQTPAWAISSLRGPGATFFDRPALRFLPAVRHRVILFSESLKAAFLASPARMGRHNHSRSQAPRLIGSGRTGQPARRSLHTSPQRANGSAARDF